MQQNRHRWFFFPIVLSLPFLALLGWVVIEYGAEIQRLLSVASKLVVIQ